MELYSASVEDGVNGIIHLIALAARPPRKPASKADKNFDRTGKALKMLKSWAAYGYYDAFGRDHPDNPRQGNRSLAHFDAPMRRLFDDFRRAVRAGRVLRQSLYSKSFATGTVIPLSFEGRWAPNAFYITSRPHTEALRREFQKSGNQLEVNVRRALWDQWLPTIHISGAFSILFDSNFAPPTVAPPWETLCRSLIVQKQVPYLVESLLTWADEIQTGMSEQAMVQNFRLVHLQRAARASAKS